MERSEQMKASVMVPKVIKQYLPAAVQKPFQGLGEAAKLRLYRPSHMRFWFRDFAARTSTPAAARIVPLGLPTSDD